jgi:hypothetical protein
VDLWKTAGWGALSVDPHAKRLRSGGKWDNRSAICKLTRRSARIEGSIDSLLWVYAKARASSQEVIVFGTIKNLIPEPRQADHPGRYVGKHRQPEPVPDPEPAPPTAEESQAAAV